MKLSRSAPGSRVLSRGERTFIAATLLLAGGIALTHLVGQWRAWPWIVTETHLGRTSPAAALALVLISAAHGLLLWRGERRAVKGLALGLLGLVAGAALVLGGRSWFAPQSQWNPNVWLLSDAARAAGLPVLPISPLTAALLVLSAGVAAIAALTPDRHGRLCRLALPVAGIVAVLAGFGALSRLANVSLVAIGELSVAFWPALAVAILNCGLAVSCGLWPAVHSSLLSVDLHQPGAIAADELQRRRRLLLLILGFGLTLIVGAFLFLRALVERGTRQFAAELTHVAELKSDQIRAWRRERIGDARVLMRAPFLNGSLPVGVGGGDEAGRRATMAAYLEEFRREYGYASVVLYDRELAPRLAAPPGSESAVQLPTALRQRAAGATDVIMEDLYAGPKGEVWLDLLVPLRGGEGQAFAGAVLLRIDARRSLFPLVERWPAVTESAEALLFRREGDWVVYLNNLRFQPDSALKFRLPAGQPGLLAHVGSAAGYGQLVDARDYRNVPVLGMVRKVPESPWSIVVKMDKVEAFQVVRSDAWRVVLGFLLLTSGAGLIAGRYWRQRQQEYELRQHRAERERQAAVERLGQVMQHANDIILVFDADTRVVEANDRAVEAYGYTRAELEQRRIRDLRGASDQAQMSGQFAAALESQGLVFETVHRRKDGTEFPVEVSARRLEIDGHPHVMSIIRDISERRAHLTEIERLNRLYFVISQVNQALVRARSEDEIFGEICRVLVEYGRFRIAWVGRLDPATLRVAAVAVAGDEHNYVAGIRVSGDPNLPEGQGPSGRALQLGHTYVCNDFFSEPGTAPWRERAVRSGFKSSIALPLRCEGKIIGLLTVYAAEVDYFDKRQVELLEETAGDVTFALDKFAQEARRRAAEAALAASEHRLEFLLSASPAVIFSLRTGDFAPTFVSANVTAVLGYSPTDFTARPEFWFEHLHPEDRAAAAAGVGEIAAGAPQVREYRFRHGDGEYRWMHDELQWVPARGDRPAEIVGFWIDISARKQAERALQEREELYSSIVNQALDAMVLVDDEGGFKEFNRAAHEGLGYTRAEFAALRITDIQAEHSPDKIRANMELIRREGGLSFETQHRHRDGRKCAVRVSASFLQVQGKSYLAAAWTDITEQRRMVDALRASEERHRALFDNMDLGVVYQDAEGAITAANSAAMHILDLTLDQLQGRTSLDPAWRALREDGSTFPGDEHPAMVALRSGARVNSVVMGIRSGQRAEVRWILVDAVPETRPGEHTPHRVFTVFKDITAQRRAEAELRKLLRAVEQNPSSIVITDLAGAIEYVNPRFTALTGYTAAEVVGQNPRILKSGVTPPAVYAELWQTITRGEVWRGEIVNRKKNGELFTELAVVTPVKDAEGRATHFVALKEDITARKRMEDVLRESERRYRLIADNTGDIIWHYNLTRQCFEYISPSVERLRGYTVAEAMQGGLTDSLMPASLAHIRQTLPARLAAFAAGDPSARNVTYELEFRRKNGTSFPAEVTTTLLVQGEKQELQMIGVTHDIAGRKQAEDSLRESEARLRALLEKVPLALAYVDSRGEVIFFNERWYQIFGYTTADVPNVAAWWQLAYPDPAYREQVHARWTEVVTRAQATGMELEPGEYRVTCADGGERLIEMSGIFLGQELLVTFIDLTARRRAEAQLRQLSGIVEQAPLSVAITDLSGIIEYVNPQFCQVTGYTLAEVRGQNPRVLKSGETDPKVYRDMWETLTRGQVWRGELRNKKKNGEIYVETAVIAPVVDEQGRATHYVALKEDITERRRMEAALRETQELYRLIAENTSDVIWLYDLAGRHFTYLSPATERLLGIPPRELVGQPMERVLSPAAQRTVAELLPARIAAFNAGDLAMQNRMVVLEHVHADGHYIIGEVVTTLLSGADGRAAQLLGVSRDITERQQAADELRRSRDRLAQAEQIARLGNWQLDLASQQVTWSDEMFRILELDPAAARPSLALWHSYMAPDDQTKLQEAFARTLATRQRFVHGTRLYFPGGRIKYVEGTGELVCAEDGTPLRAVGTLQDVTERKLIEIELHELVKGLRVLHHIAKALEARDSTREQLVQLVAHSLPPAMAFPEDTQATVEIDGCRETAGAAGAVVAELSVPILINDRPAGQVSVGYVRARSGAPEGMFYVREREMLENIARTIGLGLGEREAFAAVQRFNAELEGKVAQRTAELQARNREVQALLNSVPDMVVRLRADGTVLNFQSAKDASALAEIASQPAERNRLGPILQAPIEAAGRQALAENRTVAVECELTTTTPRLVVELRAAPIGTEEFVVFVRDISARRRREAETAAMLEKERQVSEMKSRFISVTSHEFRTPIAAAMGTVELLHNYLDRITPAKREEMFSRITTSLQRMTEMLEDLLLLNRMDSGRTQVQIAPVKLRVLVESIVDEARLGDRGVHQFVCEGDSPEVATDAQLLHHIVGNLLSNAARYSPAGTTVTTRVQVDATHYHVSVEDQGIGIPEADRERIFEAFERGSNVGTVKGTGLGLSIVKRMTQMLGGTIRIDSATGPGSRFVLTLPRAQTTSAP